MADTTPKGLRYPEDSDAPNIAVDIENLATDVDNEFDNYIANSIVTAQGDLITASGSATPARLAIGSADTYLQSDGTAVSWQPVVAGVYYIDSTAGTPLAGADLGIPEGEYIGNIFSTNNYAIVDSVRYDKYQPFYISQLSDISFLGIGSAEVWTTQTIPFSVNALTFGDNTYVAAGNSGTLATSTDGITWTTRTSGFGTTDIFSLTFGNGIFVAGGNASTLTTSTDGITWTSRSAFPPPPNAQTIRALTFGNNTYVAGGDQGVLSTSTDGITWTTRTSGFEGTQILSLTFGNNTYVAGGQSGKISTSTDGTTWTTRTSEFEFSAIRALTFANGVFVAGGTTGKISTSTDGTTWTSRTSTFGTSQINALTFSNNTFVAAGATGQLRTSTDGINWTTRTSGFATNAINALTFGNNIYIAGGSGGIRTSPVANGIVEASFAPVAQTINLP
jgi:photosystem II stability/assembly factor-like uncharacterized protein